MVQLSFYPYGDSCRPFFGDLEFGGVCIKCRFGVKILFPDLPRGIGERSRICESRHFDRRVQQFDLIFFIYNCAYVAVFVENESVFIVFKHMLADFQIGVSLACSVCRNYIVDF